MNIQVTIPYTYLIGWTQLNKWYYGVRYAYKCVPSDLWSTYFTSSKLVKEYRGIYGEPNVIEIRKTFSNAIKARKWEDTVHKRMNVVKDDKWLNRCYGNEKFVTYGLVCVKNTITGKSEHVKTDDYRFETGEIIYNSTGKMAAKDENGNIFWVNTDDDRIGTSLLSTSCGMGTAYDPLTKKCIGRISTDDPRWKTGEVVGAPHFSEKVSTNIGMIDKNDPRLLSGEASHINSKKSPAKCAFTDKPLGQISCSDIRWKTGDIVHACKGEVMAKCAKTGNFIGRIPKNDARWKTGEIVSLMKGTVMAKCAKTGSSVGRVSKDDPRWTTGTIVGIRQKLQ